MIYPDSSEWNPIRFAEQLFAHLLQAAEQPARWTTADHALTLGERTQALRCPACQTPYTHFLKTGRLGCQHCYSAFARRLLPEVIAYYHAGATYQGRPYGQSCAEEAMDQVADWPADQAVDQGADWVDERETGWVAERESDRPDEQASDRPEEQAAGVDPTSAAFDRPFTSGEAPEQVPETLEQARAALAEAVEREDYVTAAKLRDWIQAKQADPAPQGGI